ncbi:hypothetical protein LQ759_09555 [Serratia marcescens]|uniref:hypothetical protein n=1 Tax=uncultured Serratia sp. TaxID=239175 RepID=UPI001F3C158B|nr:hypothetical protein [uncultured Serratia sp.]MCF1610126.1 hypothetical protein [Serratia marcescens]
MDADLISYESMLTARDSANWAYWSMIAAFCSAGATLVAAIIAFSTINSWKRQGRAQEVRNFIFAVYNFHNAMIRTPELKPESKPIGLDFDLYMQTYKTLSAVYEAHMMIQSAKYRVRTARIFNELTKIHGDYRKREITAEKAVNDILQIRMSSPLLKSSY